MSGESYDQYDKERRDFRSVFRADRHILRTVSNPPVILGDDLLMMECDEPKGKKNRPGDKKNINSKTITEP